MRFIYSAQWWETYNAVPTYDARVKRRNFVLQGIQVLVGVGAANLAGIILSPSGFAANLAERPWWTGKLAAEMPSTSWMALHFVADIAKEMVQELLIENIISNTALNIGFSLGAAQYLGEIMGDGFEVLTVNKSQQKLGHF